MTTGTVKIGMLVQIYNQEHIWHGEIGTIYDKGVVFSRVELLGKLVWMPNHWLVEVEADHEEKKHDRI